MRIDEDESGLTVTDQAAHWFVMNRAGDLDEVERRAFGAWLEASPLHVEEYLGLARMALDMPEAAADPTVSVAEILRKARNGHGAEVLEPIAHPLEHSANHPHRDWVARRRVIGLAAGLAAAGIAVFWWGVSRGTVEYLATRHGEQRSWELSDGSVARLNTDTAVMVRFGVRERLLEIDHGQAYFEVRHDPSRQFRVLAGPTTVTAVGTKFDVYRKGDSARVTVVDGQVAVGVDGGSRRAAAGEQVEVVAGHWPPTVTAADMSRNMAWLRRQIAFHEEPLADVAAEFNRYAAVPLAIESPVLGRLPVSGVFAADDTASFVAFLGSLPGVSVQITPGRIAVQASRTDP